MEPKIIYEDKYILALDKPAGLMVHADGRSEDKTLADWVGENYPELAEVGESQILQNGEKIARPGVVHRLDRETSGVIIIAKTQESFLFLKEQFKSRKVEKVYRAFVYGKFSELKGVINKPIGRSASDFRKWSAEFGAKGELREAVTQYEVLKQSAMHAYLELKPKTGRTHQIRVHLKSISHPVIMDELYGNGRGAALGFERLALHALSISLELPNGSSKKIEAELPEDFLEAEKEIAFQ
jgi:23S rRNA pseudouridine1911/1915/1917 synthase